MASSVPPRLSAHCGTKQLSPCVQLNSARMPGHGMLRHHFMAPVGQKKQSYFTQGGKILHSIRAEKKLKRADSVPLKFQAFLPLFSKVVVAQKSSQGQLL